MSKERVRSDIRRLKNRHQHQPSGHIVFLLKFVKSAVASDLSGSQARDGQRRGTAIHTRTHTHIAASGTTLPLFLQFNPLVPRELKLKIRQFNFKLTFNGLIAKKVFCLDAHYSVLWGFKGQWCLCLLFFTIRPWKINLKQVPFRH